MGRHVRRQVEVERGLITAWPNPNGCELDEGKIVCGEFVIPGSDAPALLDPVEEALRQIAGLIWAKTDWGFAMSLRRNVGPRTVPTSDALIQSASNSVS